MNTELLMELFQTPAQSGKEKDVQHLIINYLEMIGVPYEVDPKGNIYNISYDGKPMLSAHMDTVQDYDDTLFAKFINIKDGIINGYGVIGGDDKCGIYIMLELLSDGHNELNFCFTVQEEVGGIGSEYFESNNDLTHMSYCLVLDRKGNDDILCASSHDYGTQEFEDVLLEMGKDYGYSVGHGTFCDADYFSNQLSCANISCGYYNAHSKQEFVVLRDLQNALDYVHAVVSNIDIMFEAPYSYSSYGHTGSKFSNETTSYNDEYAWMDEYDWIDEYDNKPITIDKRSDSHVDDSYCECCSKHKTSKFIRTVGITMCNDCMDDLLWELNETVLQEDTEVI